MRSVVRRVKQVASQADKQAMPSIVIPVRTEARAIEDDGFPFEVVSEIAEMESWRKEINRPLSHIHKWWAQRLGTVFRAIVLSTFAPKGADVLKLFYSHVEIPNAVVLDPFMGSGTTVAETVKFGARAIGRDINPVAYFLVRNALAIHDRGRVFETFKAIERDVAPKLRSLYEARLPDGQMVPVLYYFWVKTVPCPQCEKNVDLFSSYVFAKHAYARKFPQAQAVCPYCGEINKVRFDAMDALCSSCKKAFNPTKGPAKGQITECPYCSHKFPIGKTIRERGTVPDHRLYAKLVLMPDGSKEYLPADDFDRTLVVKAEKELKQQKNAFPVVAIEPGYNTNQALGYNYRHWHDFFNARQLLSLSILADRIRAIQEPALRDLFVCLFSGALEFNNMFASYKGEGTGAVRHMFSHHILKPERTPLEANPWGTQKSSGSFSTMFDSRILRALDYAERPFELKVNDSGNKKTSEKVYELSEAIGYECAATFSEFNGDGKRVYLSCGDSGQTDLAEKSVDAVITDPPFFDNVHYSQLADFFHVWQRHILGAKGCWTAPTTRSTDEVQNSKIDAFTERLGAVWQESCRVLKDEGLLVFTYHHSRSEGWRSVLKALMDAGLGIVATHPVKAEMSVATPKQQTKEPINLDIVVVCRKLKKIARHKWNGDLWEDVTPAATHQVMRFQNSGRSLSRNDVRIIVMAQLLRQLSVSVSTEAALALLNANKTEIENVIDTLCALHKKSSS